MTKLIPGHERLLTIRTSKIEKPG